ncbi:MAG: M1 family peptidase, partial [Chitinophagaceae bacterium]|nr:M1 family peptidase [Chitinophagaceae bacterium]
LTHWHETMDLPVKVMGIGVAEFAVDYAGDAENIPVYSWVYPADRDRGFDDYALATRVLPFFINNIAPYPYKKLANVESKTIFGGMENAGAIFYSENSIDGKGKSEKLIAHEIAHQWFGNMATERDWSHIWLSEGFATYFSLLYLESRYGSDTLDKELKANRIRVTDFYKKKQRPVVDSSVTNYMELLNVNSYEKGGWVLHMLRRQLGDSTFWKGIRNYYNKYAGKNAVTDDFRKSMEESSGRDLKQFFQQWLYTAGHPVLHIDHSFSNKMLTVTITQQQEHLFQFPFTIIIRGNGNDGDLTKATRIDKKSISFSVPMENAPADIIPDPFTSLLFEEK